MSKSLHAYTNLIFLLCKSPSTSYLGYPQTLHASLCPDQSVSDQAKPRCSKLAQTATGPFQKEDLILLCWSNTRSLWSWWAPHPHQGSILTARLSSPSLQTSPKQPQTSKPLRFFCVKQVPQARWEFLYDLDKHSSFASIRQPNV